MNGTKTNEAINELFNSFLFLILLIFLYQEGLETKMKGSDCIFERVDLLEYHLHKISLNRGSSYVDSSEWLKNKRVTISPKNTKNNKCMQYAITVALHHQEIERDHQRISKINPFINTYDWKDIEFPSHSKDWRKFEQNNKAIALNIFHIPYNTKQIRAAYISKYNHKRDNQVNLLMITNSKDDLDYRIIKNNNKWYYVPVNNNWHYLAIKIIPGLLRGIISNYNGDFYCLNCSHSYTTKKKLKKHGRICRNHEFCYVKMPDENNKILKYNPGEKSLKQSFIMCVDIECLLEKKDTCQNNPEKSYTEKKAKHTPSGYSLVTCCSFDKSKNERKYCRGKDCMEKLCNDFRDKAMKIIIYEKKEVIPLTNEVKESYEKQKNCYIYEKEFCTDKNKEKEFKLHQKVRDHYHYTGKYRGAANSICNGLYLPVVFYNHSTNDNHFIIKQLARILKNILLFQYRLIKSLIMVKRSH